MNEYMDKHSYPAFPVRDVIEIQQLQCHLHLDEHVLTQTFKVRAKNVS